MRARTLSASSNWPSSRSACQREQCLDMIRAAAHHLERALAAASRSPVHKTARAGGNGVEFHGFTTAVGVLVGGFLRGCGICPLGHMRGLKIT
ncbi:MAG TPA: hypothetical protein VKF35_12970 [Hyphomicrobiaceae bacterium]|nr:hypothetical protein [Hyphomicrobiaceae bacterium]